MALVLGNEELLTPDDGNVALGQVNPFSHLSSGLAAQAQKNVSEMLSGDAFAPTKAGMNEALARATQQRRVENAAEGAPLLGQGAAVRVQQETESNIFADLAGTQLKMAELEQAIKERGVAVATQLEGLARTNWMDKYGAMQDLIKQGGEENYAQAQKLWNDLLPGSDIDFSRAITAETSADFATGMTLIGQLVASGMSNNDALDLARSQGTIDKMGVTEDQFSSMYRNALIQANPIAAAIHEFTAAAELGEISQDDANLMAVAFMESETGLDFEYDEATGEMHIIPFDGFTRVTDLADVTAGQMIRLDTNAVTMLGANIPAGRYYIYESEGTNEDKNPWGGTTTETTNTKLWARNSETGVKYLVNEKSNDVVTEDTTGLEDLFNIF